MKTWLLSRGDKTGDLGMRLMYLAVAFAGVTMLVFIALVALEKMLG
jgi:hypothetical protein